MPITLFRDARDYQIAFLATFLLLGIGTRDWSLRPAFMVGAIATCLGVQLAATLVGCLFAPTTAPLSINVRSPLITALSLCLLLRADQASTFVLAGVLAILSKFLLRSGDKHFFNPANFGMIAALLLTGDAWVSPGQWGDDWWYVLLFAGTGGLVLKQVGRWDTTAAFLGAYGVLEAVRNLWLGWEWDVLGHRLMSGSLLLFALFMITDPRSIPNARIGRIMWAIAIALLTFILRNYFFLSTAVFWALFALAPLTVLMDSLWSAPRFSWQTPSQRANRRSGSPALFSVNP
ncbi:RnfABCDGE type electron transport complex subunit D [Trichothermofontia sp.]